MHRTHADPSVVREEPMVPSVTREAFVHILKRASLDHVALPPSWQKKTRFDFEDMVAPLDPAETGVIEIETAMDWLTNVGK